MGTSIREQGSQPLQTVGEGRGTGLQDDRGVDLVNPPGAQGRQLRESPARGESLGVEGFAAPAREHDLRGRIEQ